MEIMTLGELVLNTFATDNELLWTCGLHQPLLMHSQNMPLACSPGYPLVISLAIKPAVHAMAVNENQH